MHHGDGSWCVSQTSELVQIGHELLNNIQGDGEIVINDARFTEKSDALVKSAWVVTEVGIETLAIGGEYDPADEGWNGGQAVPGAVVPAGQILGLLLVVDPSDAGDNLGSIRVVYEQGGRTWSSTGGTTFKVAPVGETCK